LRAFIEDLLTVTSVENNSIASPLLRLPAEIRNQIWQYTLGTMQVHPTVKGTPRCTDRGSDTISDFDVDRQLALVRTCRQLYSEAGLIFYRDSTFFFNAYSAMARFRLSLRVAQLEAVQTIALSGKVLEQLQRKTRLTRFQAIGHRINYHHGETGALDQRQCPDPFCEAWGRLPDRLTLIFPHLRTLVVDGGIDMGDSEERARLNNIIEWVKRHEGLEDVAISA
jgi:hypothetical protein